MKITKLTNREEFLGLLVPGLREIGIVIHNVSGPTSTSLQFRAKRLFNKPYVGGGMKFGEPISNFPSKSKMRHSLHWEEWSYLNDLVNDICDKLNCGGSLKSYFDGELTWIRRDGKKQWKSGLTQDDIQKLKSEYQEFCLNQKKSS
jgi:hypothetical protein